MKDGEQVEILLDLPMWPLSHCKTHLLQRHFRRLIEGVSAACTYTPEIPGFLSRFLGNVGILASTAACEEFRFAGDVPGAP